MLSLAVSGLALTETHSKIETLRRDSVALSKAISGLTSASSGRSFTNHFDDLISEGAEFITEIVPVLKPFTEEYFQSSTEQDFESSLMSSMETKVRLQKKCRHSGPFLLIRWQNLKALARPTSKPPKIKAFQRDGK